MDTDRLIEKALIDRRDSMTVPSSLDSAVMSAASRGPRPGSPFVVPGTLVLALILTGCVMFGTALAPRKAMERDCRQTLSEMVSAVEARDVERSLAFYSQKGMESGRMEQNIRTFYGTYDRIDYDIKSVRIRTAKDGALAETTYTLTAVKGNETVRYSGSDRIYMARENGRLKIRHWIEG